MRPSTGFVLIALALLCCSLVASNAVPPSKPVDEGHSDIGNYDEELAAVDSDAEDLIDLMKRYREPVRFGKRAREPLRFGKRAREPVRFGKRAPREPLRFGKRDFREPIRFGKRSTAQEQVKTGKVAA